MALDLMKRVSQDYCCLLYTSIVHLYILNFDVVHLAAHFGCVDTRIGHFQIVGIPQCRTPADRCV